MYSLFVQNTHNIQTLPALPTGVCCEMATERFLTLESLTKLPQTTGGTTAAILAIVTILYLYRKLGAGSKSKENKMVGANDRSGIYIDGTSKP